MKRTMIVSAAVLGLVFISGRGAVAEGGQGYLGVLLAPLPESLAEQVGAEGGVMLGDVLAGSPAEKAGLRRHDIVTGADGSRIDGMDALRRAIQSKKPGDPIKLAVRRGKETLEVEAKLGEAPARPDEKGGGAEKPRAAKPSGAPAKGPGFLGIGFAEVDPALAAHLGLEEGSGVLVGSVWKDSPAARAGIEKNDVIVSVDGEGLKGARGIVRMLGEKRAGDTVKVKVIHKGQERTVEAVLVDRPRELEGSPGARFPFGYPGLSNRGRVTIKRGDGSEESFDITGEGWSPEEIFRQFEERFKGLRGFVGPDELNERLRKLMEDMDVGDRLAPGGSSFESRSAVARIVEGGYDVTVRDQDGTRTVTVKQGDKVLAEDLPFDKIDTLAEEARDLAKKAAASLDAAGPAPVPLGGEKKIKA
jgi:membrane-associated protease RseP (regulator of RpoE activity)